MGARSKNIIKLACDELTRQGVAIVTADEFQFLTQSSANAQVAKTLMQLSRLGPPFVYIANYSLLHRLSSRPQEERQRLLTDIVVIRPDAVDGEDWRRLLVELLRVAPEFSELNVDKCGIDIHRYTFGLKRQVRGLLCGAYVSMRKRGEKRVRTADIEQAYLSLDYAASRQDVEALKGNDVKQKKKRSDLWCPLQGSEASSFSGVRNVVAHPATAEHERRVREALINSSMTIAQRAEHQQEKNVSDAPPQGKSKVERLRRPATTAESLLRGAEEFDGGKKK